MGEIDAVTKKYMQNNERFADVFNFYIYNGRQVIDPAKLRNLDTTAIALPFGDNDSPKAIQKYRDILKSAEIKIDDTAVYLVLGIENESKVHNAMVVRNYLYDAVNYANQVDEKAKSHRKNKDKPESSDEFLSGFYKTDRLTPVITLTIYFGEEEWTAAKSLHEMFAVKDKEILRFVPDYKLNLLDPSNLTNEDFEKFTTELQTALKCVKHSKDKEELKKFSEELVDKTVSRETIDLINVVTGTKLKYPEGKESVNMFKGVKELLDETREQGIELGREQGLEQGREQGLEQGREQGLEQGREQGLEQGREQGIAIGEEKGRIKTLISLFRQGLLSLMQAAEAAHMTVPEFEQKLAMYTE